MTIVDSSAVLALIRQEPGSERFADRIKGATISAVNHSEVIAKLADHGLAEIDGRKGMESLNLVIVSFDRAQSERAGQLRDATRCLGLSLGDRACIALALTLAAPVLTTDRIWLELDIGVDIELAR